MAPNTRDCMRMRVLAMLLAASVMTTASRADSVLQASQLISYFGAGCASQGEWTRTAIAQATALADVLKSLEKDPDCTTFAGAIGQLGTLSQAVSRLQSDPNSAQILQLKSEEQEVLLQIAQ